MRDEALMLYCQFGVVRVHQPHRRTGPLGTAKSYLNGLAPGRTSHFKDGATSFCSAHPYPPGDQRSHQDRLPRRPSRFKLNPSQYRGSASKG